VGTPTRPGAFHIDSADAQQWADPQVLLAAADHFYWLNNGPAAAPLYARSEKLFSERSDARNELHAKVGRLRSEAETMSFVDLSRFLNEQLQNPIVQGDKRLRSCHVEHNSHIRHILSSLNDTPSCAHVCLAVHR